MQLNELQKMLKEHERPKFANGDPVWLEYDGKTLNLCQWADELGYSAATICKRHKRYLAGKLPYEKIFK